MKKDKANKSQPEADPIPTGPNWRIPELFPELGADIHAKLKAYHSELIFFNGRMNLISTRTEANADIIHIADGIFGSRLVLADADHEEIYDVGSGNGVPGLILALLAPKIKVKLVDIDARKIEYMKHCIFRLGLKNCTALHSRVEDLPKESIHCAVSRGFSNISKSILAMRKCAAIGCQYYHFKSTSWSSEVAEIPSQIMASWEPRHIADYKLPTTGALMSVIVTTRMDYSF